METPIFITDLFKSIDAMNSDKFVSFLTEDAGFKFGNAPVVTGKEAIKKSVQDFFSTINGLSHKLTNTWTQQDSIICQGEVTYTRKDEKKVTIPFVNIFNMKEDLVKEYLIYIDVGPLFAE